MIPAILSCRSFCSMPICRKTPQWDRTLTHYLYGGDQHYRLCQEVILGIGGVRHVARSGIPRYRRFHMNEGHASLLTLELLDEEAKRADRANRDSTKMFEAVRGSVCLPPTPRWPPGMTSFPWTWSTACSAATKSRR